MERPLERLSQAYTRHLQGADVTAVTQADFFDLRIRFAAPAHRGTKSAYEISAILQELVVQGSFVTAQFRARGLAQKHETRLKGRAACSAQGRGN
jgi:hypothetical protein